MNYYFEDFTEINYQELLKTAIKNYKFIKYRELSNFEECIIWRHDIDHSIHRALALAKIENKEKVKSTFFIHIGSLFYNIFEIKNKQIIKDILGMGHDIGIHFDPSSYNIYSKKDLEHYLMFEKDLLERLFGIEIDVFSFHNPTDDILKYKDFRISGMINTYAKVFQIDIGYCSDSNGYWRHDRLFDILNNVKYQKLQVLTHPCWWQKEVMSPNKRIKRCLDGRKNSVESFYNNILKAYGRENIE